MRASRSAAPVRPVADIAATTLCRAVRAAPSNGMGPLRAIAKAIAAASLGLKFSGGRVWPGSIVYPPLGPGVAQIGTPASCRARMSRWMVRTLTSKRPASRAALRDPGAAARSSSTRAYRRSVRFIVAPRYRADVTAAPNSRGRRLSMAVPTRSWPHTSGPIGCDHDERIVPVDLVASPDKLQRGVSPDWNDPRRAAVAISRAVRPPIGSPGLGGIRRERLPEYLVGEVDSTAGRCEEAEERHARAMESVRTPRNWLSSPGGLAVRRHRGLTAWVTATTRQGSTRLRSAGSSARSPANRWPP